MTDESIVLLEVDQTQIWPTNKVNLHTHHLCMISDILPKKD